MSDTETKKDLSQPEKSGVPVIAQAIDAYRKVVASPEFREVMRLQERARREEAIVLRQAAMEEREKWLDTVAEKDALIAEIEARLERCGSQGAQGELANGDQK